MNKREFTNIISRFEPDNAMKERIERKVLNMEVTERKPKKSIKKTVAISILAAAITLAASVPVMAEHIPAVKNAMDFLFGSYSKEPIEHNDAVPELAQNINATAKDTESGVLFNVQDVYYDGEDIAIYYLFEAPDPAFSKYTGLSSEDFELYANGERIVWSEEDFYESVRIISSGKCGENCFAGMINFKADVLPQSDNFNMEIKINSLQCSEYKLVFNYDIEDPRYDWQAPDTIPANISCKFDVSKTNGLIKTYEIGEEKAGYTLNTVTITPLKTIIDLSMPDDNDIVCTFTDNNGNELDFMGKYEFDAPLKDATSLTLTLMNKVGNGFSEICSFTFDIDGGYRSANIAPEYTSNGPEYVPSLEESDRWLAENRGW